MQIGLLTDSLSSLTRTEALDTAAELGVATVEIGLGGVHGGWSPAPHADLVELLSDATARATLASATSPPAVCGWRRSTPPAIRSTRCPATATTECSVGAIQLAEEFEIGTVVTMSGSAGVAR